MKFYINTYICVYICIYTHMERSLIEQTLFSIITLRGGDY